MSSSTYFPDQSTKTCQLCSTTLPNCQQCQSSTICKVCQTNYLLKNSTCISQPACQSTPQHYVNILLKKCSQCVPPCGNCTNTTHCLNGYFSSGKCPFTCPTGTYANLTSKHCLSCDPTLCKTCTTSPPNAPHVLTPSPPTSTQQKTRPASNNHNAPTPITLITCMAIGDAFIGLWIRIRIRATGRAGPQNLISPHILRRATTTITPHQHQSQQSQ